MEKKLAGGFLASLSLKRGLCMDWAEGTPNDATLVHLTPVAFSELILDLENLREP